MTNHGGVPVRFDSIIANGREFLLHKPLAVIANGDFSRHTPRWVISLRDIFALDIECEGDSLGAVRADFARIFADLWWVHVERNVVQQRSLAETDSQSAWSVKRSEMSSRLEELFKNLVARVVDGNPSLVEKPS